jgi:hypothetical protein
MIFKAGPFDLHLSDDDSFTPGSRDNVRTYKKTYNFAEGNFSPPSKHGLLVTDGTVELASCIFLAGGGKTAVHLHSLVAVQNKCMVAVGNTVCALEVPTLNLLWHRPVDSCTCFGVYLLEEERSLISHGELEIVRLSLMGKIEWRTGGADIFTGSFRLYEDYIEAVDFNGQLYRIDLDSGETKQ